MYKKYIKLKEYIIKYLKDILYIEKKKCLKDRKHIKDNKLVFFIKNRKILWILGIVNIIFLFIVIFLNKENIINTNSCCWNILINIDCGYIVSLIFYIILVYSNEYSEYRKNIIGQTDG